MSTRERRASQRLKLAKPLLATMDSHSALILDIGVGGVFVEHRGRAAEGLKVRLAFKWQGSEIAFGSEVVRSGVIREGGEEGVVSHSALVFHDGETGSEERLRDMMGTFVTQLLAAHRENAAAAEGRGAAILAQLGQARRSRSRGLMTYTWDGIEWSRTPTESPQQPLDGFTVPAYEDEEELAMLCQTYETADAEARNMIRLVAELSVRTALQSSKPST